MIYKSEGFLHTLAENNESYRFLLLYHRIFNIIMVKQLNYLDLLLFVIISKYQ